MKNNVTIRDVYKLVETLRKEVKNTYVTRSEFLPVKAVAYGIVSIVSIAVATALLATVVRAFR